MNLKRVVCFVLSLIMVIGMFCMPASATSGVKVVLNGKEISFDVQPQIINGRTMVPMRAIFEALGAKVEWNNDTRTATGTKTGIVVSLTIDETTMYKNFYPILLDTPAQLVDGRTLVPVRAISESFGVDVKWDGATQSVFLTDMNVLKTIQISEALFYEGELADGLPLGYGTLYEKSSVVDGVYIGYWNGLVQQSGIASERYSNGDAFVGYITDNISNGYGEYTSKSGEIYKGNYINGKRNGMGEYHFANGDVYKGNYENDVRSGYGEYYCNNGDYYKGNFLNGELNGYGEYYYANGDYYKGDNLNGEAHGYGEYYWKNGSYYKGDYSNGVRHGRGVLYDAQTDTTLEGEFRNGEMI